MYAQSLVLVYFSLDVKQIVRMYFLQPSSESVRGKLSKNLERLRRLWLVQQVSAHLFVIAVLRHPILASIFFPFTNGPPVFSRMVEFMVDSMLGNFSGPPSAKYSLDFHLRASQLVGGSFPGWLYLVLCSDVQINQCQIKSATNVIYQVCPSCFC